MHAAQVDREFLFLLRSNFTEIVADLLRMLLLQVNAVNSGRVALIAGPEAFFQNVGFMLNQTRLETPVSTLGGPISFGSIPLTVASLSLLNIVKGYLGSRRE